MVNIVIRRIHSTRKCCAAGVVGTLAFCASFRRSFFFFFFLVLPSTADHCDVHPQRHPAIPPIVHMRIVLRNHLLVCCARWDQLWRALRAERDDRARSEPRQKKLSNRSPSRSDAVDADHTAVDCITGGSAGFWKSTDVKIILYHIYKYNIYFIIYIYLI